MGRNCKTEKKKMKLAAFSVLLLSAEAAKKDQVTKRVDNLESLWNQNLANPLITSSVNQKKIDNMSANYKKFAWKAKDRYNKLKDNKGCSYPSHWKGDDVDQTRFLFDQKDACTAVKQFTNQLLEWSAVFNVHCKQDEQPWLEHFESGLVGMSNRVLDRLSDSAVGDMTDNCSSLSKNDNGKYNF